MPHERRAGSFPILVAVGVLASIVLLATACNTSQAPDRQVKDAQITTQVKAKLASDVRASSITNIDVNTTNGIVTLSGQVESQDVAHSAERVAAAVPGVLRVNNESAGKFKFRVIVLPVRHDGTVLEVFSSLE